MPKSGSIDIPHVTVHDHYIRKPMSKKDKEGIKEFIGLYAINEKNPTPYTKAKAYLNQYEKFENKASYLDSAAFYLTDKTPEATKANIELLVQLNFIKNNFGKIVSYTNALTDTYLLGTKLTKASYSNENAWTSYRIGEAFYNTGNVQRAIAYFKNAVKLAPYGLDFKNKLGAALAASNQLDAAEQQYAELLKEYPKHVSALTNLGYIKLTKGKANEAEALYVKALSYDPDYEPLLMNLAGYYAYKKDFKRSETYLIRVLKRNPDNQQAKKALNQIKQFI
jgi:predicted Zn-dependent protease